MFVRSILSSYSKLLTGAALAFAVFALAGCKKRRPSGGAGTPGPDRHGPIRAATPERSFVGTIRPRIETDMGFRVPGKVAKRLVEVGQMVEVGQPLATARRGRPEAAGRAGGGRIPRRHRRAGAGRRLRAPRQGAAGQGLDHRCADGSGARRRRRGAGRVNRAERSVELTKNSLSYATLMADSPRRRHLDAGRAGPGGRRRPGRDPRRAHRREGSRGRHARDAGWPCSGRRCARVAVVGAEQEICREAARARAVGRSGDPHLSGKILDARRRRRASSSA